MYMFVLFLINFCYGAAAISRCPNAPADICTNRHTKLGFNNLDTEFRRPTVYRIDSLSKPDLADKIWFTTLCICICGCGTYACVDYQRKQRSSPPYGTTLLAVMFRIEITGQQHMLQNQWLTSAPLGPSEFVLDSLDCNQPQANKQLINQSTNQPKQTDNKTNNAVCSAQTYWSEIFR